MTPEKLRNAYRFLFHLLRQGTPMALVSLALGWCIAGVATGAVVWYYLALTAFVACVTWMLGAAVLAKQDDDDEKKKED